MQAGFRVHGYDASHREIRRFIDPDNPGVVNKETGLSLRDTENGFVGPKDIEGLLGQVVQEGSVFSRVLAQGDDLGADPFIQTFRNLADNLQDSGTKSPEGGLSRGSQFGFESVCLLEVDALDLFFYLDAPGGDKSGKILFEAILEGFELPCVFFPESLLERLHALRFIPVLAR